MKIKDHLGQRILFFDGAMGTMLQAAGLEPGQAPESWNLSHPDRVTAIHRSYLDAGADVILTNTFGANGVKYADSAHSVEEVVSAAVSLAKKAAAEAGHGWVALDLGPTGRLLKPMGDLDFEDAVEAFALSVRAGAAAGADLILIETMSDLYEIKAAILAAKESCDLPIFASLIFDEKGKLLTGGDISSAVALLEGLGVDVIGLNCGLGPAQMSALLPQLREAASLPILLMPNAGLPQCTGGCTHFDVEPEEFARQMEVFAREGAWLLGGCCGTTPAHIKALTQTCRDIPPLPLAPKRRTWVSSYARTVVFGADPVLIGERINPTGKPRLKQALRERDLDYLLREAVTQQEKGACVLDVNVGLPEVNETELLTLALPRLQSVTDLPLQIDTSDMSAMEAALRLYNGRPLINSVNGKEESMRAIFPLMKKYGGTAIALTLDEGGIPATAQERLAIARRIVDTAAAYGIPRENLVFDTLAMTVSADPQAALTTLEALSLIRSELGCRTCLGVSNVSFGLPRREKVNAAFLLLALREGLSAAIVNPCSDAMLDAFYSYRTLAGLDANCQDYIAHADGQVSLQPSPAAAMELGSAVLRGLADSAVAAARAELEHKSPLDVISTILVPALDRVGRDFESGVLYLPQLLMSAEAARAAFQVVNDTLRSSGQSAPASKGKVILATVKGDVHDIGKNIVKVLLENYGYQVLDLGKDVEPQLVVDTARRESVSLVGLSALMTTTVSQMEVTIRLLRQNIPACKIMVGGAVLTADYAASIGADHYAKDAMGSVRYADQVLG